MPKPAQTNKSSAADSTYRGRFAPSPTGPLHFGSLLAAVGSFLQARARGGKWFVRIEDIDPPREVPGATDEILRTLEAFGLHWDGEVVRQSECRAAYDDAIDQLTRLGALYPCACSRREIADSSIVGIDGPVYPGTCRDGIPQARVARALRVRTDNRAVEFIDRWQGAVHRQVQSEFGDFVLKRADGPIAYQLAVVLDDAAQGITEVVRGADLLESTPRQIHLQRLLKLTTPEYAHLPVVANGRGEKLSKQTHAAPIDRRAPLPALYRVLDILGQGASPELHGGNLADLWRWAIAHWQPSAVPRLHRVIVETELQSAGR